MDKYERRRLKLIELRDTKGEGKAANIARKIEREPSYVSRMMYPEGKAGKKRISDDMMELIETKYGLPRGWMDGLSYRPTENQKEWDMMVWLVENADAEIRTMLSMLTKAMYDKKSRAQDRLERDLKNAGSGESQSGLSDAGRIERVDEVPHDDD